MKRVSELTVPLGKRRLHQLLLTDASMPVRSASSTTMMNTTTTMPESAQYHLARLNQEPFSCLWRLYTQQDNKLFSASLSNTSYGHDSLMLLGAGDLLLWGHVTCGHPHLHCHLPVRDCKYIANSFFVPFDLHVPNVPCQYKNSPFTFSLVSI